MRSRRNACFFGLKEFKKLGVLVSETVLGVLRKKQSQQLRHVLNGCVA
jgi:hypothetical protein